MRTLKFKGQPTYAFFATVNQTFGGSSQLPTMLTELGSTMWFDYCAFDSSQKLGGAAEHLIDGSEKPICWLTFELKSPHVIETRSKPLEFTREHLKLAWNDSHWSNDREQCRNARIFDKRIGEDGERKFFRFWPYSKSLGMESASTFSEWFWWERCGYLEIKLKIHRHVLSSYTWPQIWSFHVVVKTRTAKKCIKMWIARAGRAKLYCFCSLNVFLCGVLAAVIVVVAEGSLLLVFTHVINSHVFQRKQKKTFE